MNSQLPALDRYRTHAERLGQRFQALASEDVLRVVAGFLPEPPAKILDVGAGSGRDACRFASEGHKVTAVEPVREMAVQANTLAGADRVEWIEDHLPDLAELQDSGFDLCLLSGVWHHLSHDYRPAALRRLTGLLRPGGRLVMSLRLGPDTDGKTNIAIDTDQTIRQAIRTGLTLLHRAAAPSNNPKNMRLGITWDWLVFERKETP